jgi:hypothetical protein
MIWEIDVVPKQGEVFGDIGGGHGTGEVMKNDVSSDL